MKHSHLIAAVLFVLAPAALLAQEGKLRGKVTDKQTGDPLIGAHVIIAGATLGAATDVNGDYIILGVPPGVFTVRVS